MKFFTVFATFVCMCFPSIASACSVCFDPNDEARIAFIITTGLLTFIPLIAMWLLFRWFKRKAEEFDRETQLLLAREISDIKASDQPT
jgi:hypothetical protein